MNKEAFEIISKFEGCKLKAYPDPASGGYPWTIGFGETHNVHPGDVITPEQAKQMLEKRIENLEQEINKLVSVIIDKYMMGALISFSYNLGIGKLKSSQLLKYLNNQQYQEAANEFLKYDHADGKVLPGLLKRRQAEKELFLTTG